MIHKYNFNLIVYSYDNFRKRLEDEALSLRKNRLRQDLFSRRKFLIEDSSRHQVCPFKLKGIPENILEKFRIKDNDLEKSVKITLQYLKSKELDEIKFGAFLLRRFFLNKIELSNELEKKNQKLDYKIDTFIDNGVIPIRHGEKWIWIFERIFISYIYGGIFKINH